MFLFLPVHVCEVFHKFHHLKKIRSEWLPKKNLVKNGNGRVNQYGVKMLFQKRVTPTLSPSPAIQQNSRRDELPSITSTPCYPSASRITRKRPLEEHRNNERLLFLLLIELYLSDIKFSRPFTQTAGLTGCSVCLMYKVNITGKSEAQRQGCLEFALAYGLWKEVHKLKGFFSFRS